MCDVNNATLLGRLVRDPEVRSCQTGIMATFSLGAKFRRRTRDGQAVEDVAYVPCICFGAPAERARDYHRGDRVCATGRLRTTSWLRDGARCYRLELVVDCAHYFHSADGQSSRPSGAPTEDLAAASGAGEEKSVPF